MRVHVGTSGFSYKGWEGPFYPEDLPQARWLAHYSSRLPAVEINNTFYRMPKAEVMARWASEVEPGFRFVIKASQRITHRSRLVDCADSVDYLWRAIEPLGEHLGPLLFQLPPNFKADTERLASFLSVLPEGCRAAFEFRHPSWKDEAVDQVLHAAGAALCVADQEDADPPERLATATWGYLRLRRPSYTDDELAEWAARVRAQDWEEAFVFFKHEDAGEAPRQALRLAAAFDALG